MVKQQDPFQHYKKGKFIKIVCLFMFFSFSSKQLQSYVKKPEENRSHEKKKKETTKVYFRSDKVSAFLKKQIIKAEENVRVSYQDSTLQTNLAFLYLDKKNTLFKIVASKKPLFKKKDLVIKAKKITYYLKTSTIKSVGKTQVTKKNSVVTGNNIIYNLKTDELTGENISGSL